MKLKNVCPYRVGQKVYHPAWEYEHDARPIVKIEQCEGKEFWRVWVPNDLGNGIVYWSVADRDGRRLIVVE